MANRLASTILLVLGTSIVLSSCDDGDDRVDDMTGGEAGSDGGTKTGGSSSGGTSAGKGGKGGSSTVGGEGGQNLGQAGAAGDAGMTGEGGDSTMGGAPVGGGATEGGASGMGGAGGEGGAENPPVVFACGSQTLNRRLCSALVAADCETLPACEGDPMPDPCCTDCTANATCGDCVAGFDGERPTFTDCPACLAEYERNLLCAIEPFEAGNLSEGVACFDGYGAERSLDCEPIFLSALACLDEIAVNGCPATWPME